MKKPQQKVIRQKPPRYLDPYSQGVILLGGMIQQIGWAFFSFSMIFFWAFVGNSELFYLLESRSDWAEIQGKVIEIEPTNMSEGDVTIQRNTFTFIHDYREYEGASFTVGRDFREGEAVWVRYDLDKPENSLIKDTRRAPFGYGVVLVLLFPLVGCIMILIQFRRNQVYLKLLKLGVFTLGKQVNKERTGGSITVNNVTYPIYKYTFEFVVKGIPYQAICQTHQVELVEDEEREIVLYDPLHPKTSMVYDAVTNAPKIDTDGYLKPVSGGKIAVFALPLLTALINLIGWLLIM